MCMFVELLFVLGMLLGDSAGALGWSEALENNKTKQRDKSRCHKKTHVHRNRENVERAKNMTKSCHGIVASFSAPGRGIRETSVEAQVLRC